MNTRQVLGASFPSADSGELQVRKGRRLGWFTRPSIGAGRQRELTFNLTRLRVHVGSFPGVCVHPAGGTHACVSLLCQLRDSRSEDSPEHSSPPEFSFQHYSLRRGTRDPWRRGWYWGKAYKMDLEHLAGPESRNLLEEDQGRPRERPVAKARTIRATEQSSIGSNLKYKTSNHGSN